MTFFHALGYVFGPLGIVGYILFRLVIKGALDQDIAIMIMVFLFLALVAWRLFVAKVNQHRKRGIDRYQNDHFN